MRIPLVGQSYSARSLAAAAQTTINLYPEPTQDPNEKDKGVGALYGTPGKHLFADLSSSVGSPFRGIWSGGGRVWYAGGTKYAEISSAGAVVGSVRTIADDATHTPVQFFANGNQLFIVSAGKAYVDNGAGPTAITLPAFTGTAQGLGLFTDWLTGDQFDPGMEGQNFTIGATTKVVDKVLSPVRLSVTVTWGGSLVTGNYTSTPTFAASSGAFLDGYFIASRSNTKQFNISDLLDGTNSGTYIWDPLAFAQKESYPDYIRSILVNGEQLYLFGTESFEVWQNVGGADFPFQRIDGATGRWGVSSPWSAIAIEGKVFFHASNAEGQISAYVMDGVAPRRISTYAQESDWQNTLLGSTIISFSYFEEGHHFWGMDPGSSVSSLTWFYDLQTGAWHQRARYVAGAFAAYGTAYHTFVTNSPTSGNTWGTGGKHLVGGDGTGKIYEQSLAFYDDVGTDIKWQRALPYNYQNGGNWIFFGRMTLEMESGTVASGPEPTITRDYSDDRGHTFTGGVTAGIGVNADFSRRVYWPTGGASRDRVWRLSGIGQSKVALVELNCEVSIGVT